MAEKHAKGPLPDRPSPSTVEKTKVGQPDQPAASPTKKGERVWMTGTASPSTKKSSEKTES